MKDTEKKMHISSANRLIRNKLHGNSDVYLAKKWINLTKLLEFIKLY